MSAKAQPRMTPEQYLEADRAAEIRSEFFDGEMFAMTGGSLRHSQLIGNVNTEVRQALRGMPCIVYVTEARVRATRSSYMYPDVAVVCGKPEVAGDQNDILLNPTVIVEVLSPSTEAHDRGLKFLRYRRMESLREYVLVSQDAPRVEVFRRQEDGRWLMTEHSGLERVCRLESLDCAIPLAGIYERVEFTPDQLGE
jgi:Uma2 family endonuclease